MYSFPHRSIFPCWNNPLSQTTQTQNRQMNGSPTRTAVVTQRKKRVSQQNVKFAKVSKDADSATSEHKAIIMVPVNEEVEVKAEGPKIQVSKL